MKKSDFTIKEVCGEGVVVILEDDNDIDDFSDYLNEKRYVLYDQEIGETFVKFCFGEGSSVATIEAIIDDFLRVA